MGVELETGQVERLLELDRKFGKEGLTFDDVLLVPAESRVLPNDVSTATRLTRAIRRSISLASTSSGSATSGHGASVSAASAKSLTENGASSSFQARAGSM